MQHLYMVPFEMEQAEWRHASERIRMDKLNVVVVQVQPYKACEARQSAARDHSDFIVAHF